MALTSLCASNVQAQEAKVGQVAQGDGYALRSGHITGRKYRCLVTLEKKCLNGSSIPNTR